MIGFGSEDAILAAARAAPAADAREPTVAGLVDGDGLCVNAILVHLDETTGEPVGYAAPEGLQLVVHPTAAIGRRWNGSEFIAGPEE